MHRPPDFIKSVSVPFLGCVLMCSLFFSCSQEQAPKELVEVDLDSIAVRGTLRVLLDYNSTNYFVYRGEPMGFEYDLLKRFAQKQGLLLEIVIVTNMDSVFDYLHLGYADMAAGNLTVTRGREQQFAFAEPLLYTRMVLIQRKAEVIRKGDTLNADYFITHKDSLHGKLVHVRKNSAYYTQLRAISHSKENPVRIAEMPGSISTEELMELVQAGEIRYTVSDQNIALANKDLLPGVDMDLPLSPPIRIAWAVRKNSPVLLDSLSEWLKTYKHTKEYKALVKKYFGNKQQKTNKAKQVFFETEGGVLSPYDRFIMKHAQRINWDWKLLASLIYQESRFNHTAQSWAGASGIMQLMPQTAERYGIDSSSGIEQHIAAGVKLLQYFDKQLQESITDSITRIKFVLAAYNVGLGHVQDAQRLAQKFGASDTLWEEHTATYMLHKSERKYYSDEVVKHGYCRGKQAVNFVQEVLQRHEHYKNMETAGKLKIPDTN